MILCFLFIQGKRNLIKTGFDITQLSVSTSRERFWTSIMKKTVVSSAYKIRFESSSLRIRSLVKIVNKIGTVMLPVELRALLAAKESNNYYMIHIVADWKNKSKTT